MLRKTDLAGSPRVTKPVAAGDADCGRAGHFRRSKHPNIVFIMSDQHRHDIWEKYRKGIRTPHLLELAAEGTTFSHCCTVAQACVPARASALTGRYAELHRTWSNFERLAPWEETWGSVLGHHGYQTLAVGRTHRIDNGFEPLRVPFCASYPMINYTNVHEVPWGPDGFVAKSPVKFEEFYEARVAKTAVQVMEDMARNQPFAMYVGFITPHPPFVMPEPFFSMYNAEEMVLEPNAPPPRFERIQKLVGQDFGVHLPEKRQRELQAAYFGMVSMLDDCVGIVLDGLRRLGLEENTIVVYTSDHGEQMGHRGLWNKCFGYDPSFRIPLIMRQKGVIPAGNESNTLIESVDHFPTLLDGAGVGSDLANGAQNGRSYWGVALGNAKCHRDWVYGASGRGRIYRDHQWKLWYELSSNDANGELYDLEKDPNELDNLFDDSRHKERRDFFIRKLFNFSIDGLQESISLTMPSLRQEAVFNAQFKK